MSEMVDGLLFGWNKNLDYGQRLIADLEEDQMVLQPVENGTPANHPAWIFSHINIYLPVIEALIQGTELVDPREHRFGMQSRPERDRGIYASKRQLLGDFVAGHQDVETALRSRGEAVFDQAMTLERWKSPMPTVGIALPYLMLVHENQHFGQVSAWRRVLGLPSV